MRRLMDMIHRYQEINIVENGISFAEEGFNQLYEEALKANDTRINELKFTLGKGIVIGSVSTGVMILGVQSFINLRKRKLDIVEKENGVEENEIKDDKSNSKSGKLHSFDVWYESESGVVDNVVVDAYSVIDAIKRVTDALEDGEMITITDVHEVYEV